MAIVSSLSVGRGWYNKTLLKVDRQGVFFLPYPCRPLCAFFLSNGTYNKGQKANFSGFLPGVSRSLLMMMRGLVLEDDF